MSDSVIGGEQVKLKKAQAPPEKQEGRLRETR
jgi:hypothetical protein